MVFMLINLTRCVFTKYLNGIRTIINKKCRVSLFLVFLFVLLLLSFLWVIRHLLFLWKLRITASIFLFFHWALYLFVNLVLRVLRLVGQRAGCRERLWRSKKEIWFSFFFLFHWLFTVTKLRTGDRRISAVKIPVPKSLSSRPPAD